VATDSYGNLIPAAPAVTPSAPTSAPTQYNFDTPLPGYTPDSWAKLIQGNSDYMGFKLSAAEQQDTAAANRKAALRTLAVRYGGIPAGFTDTYGDLDPQTLQTARDNPYSNSAQLARQYSEDVFSRRQSLGARGMTQSGELPFELGQADYSHGSGLYDLANSFGDSTSSALKDYAGTLTGLRQQQIDAIRRAAQSVYDQGYRLGGAGGAGGGGGGGAGDIGWDPGAMENVQRAGYDPNDVASQISAWAAARGWTVNSVKQEGTSITQGGLWVKVNTPQGSSTEWVPISQPAPQQSAPTPAAVTQAATAATPTTYTAPAPVTGPRAAAGATRGWE
jgi:hypothetical protein